MAEPNTEAPRSLNLLGIPITLAVGLGATLLLGFVYGYLTSLIPFIVIMVSRGIT